MFCMFLRRRPNSLSLVINSFKPKRTTPVFPFRNKMECDMKEPVAISAEMQQANFQNANTQCGSFLTVDEENIVVLVKSYSPEPSDEQPQLDFEEKNMPEMNVDQVIEGGLSFFRKS
ncbi:uncharacterized protein LOC116170110 [Photinus pyralis]|uniref:uncharacterized protein LOC116170110 n=1 Tax=Photinus pyralis TaxID=7054 RepID=UPI0012676715|nr:uncharacterized protein LOC116170110 [Photinus pyralis]